MKIPGRFPVGVGMRAFWAILGIGLLCGLTAGCPTGDDDDVTGDDDDDGPIRASSALILDQELRHHALWVDVLDSLAGAGLDASYRRFYPHLTATDVDLADGEYPHEIVVMAAGRRPGNPCHQMRADEIEPAVRFVQQGGVLVLVPQSAWWDSQSGENDFFVLNRILEELAVPVRYDRNTIIGDTYTDLEAHEAQDWGYPTPLEFQLGYPYLLTEDDERIAGGSAPTLRVSGDEVQVLLRTYDEGFLWQNLSGAQSVAWLQQERAVAALAAAGDGYVAVVPRGPLLASSVTGHLSDKPALDAEREAENRAWVEALFAQLHGLAADGDELEVTVSLGGDELFSVASPDHEALDPALEVIEVSSVHDRDVPDTPPDGTLVETPSTPPTDPRTFPDWFHASGGRIAYGGLAPENQDMVQAFDEAVSLGLDALMTSTDPSRLATLSGDDLAAEQASYAEIAALAEEAGAMWIVGDWFNMEAGDYPEMIGAHGYAGGVPAPLHEAHWADVVIPIYEAVGQTAADNPGLGGLHIDLELYSGPIQHHDGWGFSDDSLEVFLDGEADDELAADLRDATASRRMDVLVDAGRLGDYFGALEQRAYELGVRCREAAHAHDPGLQLMVYMAGFPDTWFHRGLLRGLGTADSPVIVLTYEGWHGRAADALYADGIHLAHLGGTIVSHWTPDDFGTALVSLATGTDGYWYFTFNDLSLTNPTPPDLHGQMNEYWVAITAANYELGSGD